MAQRPVNRTAGIAPRIVVVVVLAGTLGGCRYLAGFVPEPVPSPSTASSPVAVATSTARPTPTPRWTTGPELPPFASLPTAPVAGLPSHGRIAFNVEWGEDGDQYKNVLTIEPDGTDLRQLTNLAPGSAAAPAWTPDGNLVYSLTNPSATANHLTFMDGSGGSQRRLTAGNAYDDNPQVSNDGTQVVFDRHTFTSNSTVILMKANGTGVHALTHPDPSAPDGDWMADLSPDGKQVAFIRDGDLYVVGVDGRHPRLVLHGDGSVRAPRWSPDGTRLLFDFDEGRVSVINLDGTGLTHLAAGADASWSPDGSLIAYRTYREGTRYLSLAVMHADGSDPRVIWHTPDATDIFIAWTDWGTAD
jgi:Tol biopolymer transport system component